MYPFHITYSFWGQTIEFGPYGLFFSLAVIVVSGGSFWYMIHHKIPLKTILPLLSLLFLASLIGARLFNVATHWDMYMVTPSKIYSLDSTGFSLYGGVLFSMLIGYWYCKKKKIDPFRLADYLAPFAGIGIAIFRIGCFLRGCCFGQETSLPWGVTFPLLSPAHIHQLNQGGNFFSVTPVHPTQLYELGFSLLLGIAALVLIHKKMNPGIPALFFTIFFSLCRLLNDMLRIEIDPHIPPYFYPIVYGIILMMSIVFLKQKTRSFSQWYQL